MRSPVDGNYFELPVRRRIAMLGGLLEIAIVGMDLGKVDVIRHVGNDVNQSGGDGG